MDNNELRLGRLHQCTFEQALELRKRGFEGYHAEMAIHYPGFARPPAPTGVPVPGELDRMLDGFGTEGIRPELSVVCFAGDKPVGFVFIAVKQADGKKLVWNGGTGVFPEYRGKGIAKAMMLEAGKVIREQEADHAFLEVVAKNEHAIRAYQKGGFEIADRLIGMTCAGTGAAFFDRPDGLDGIRLVHGAPSAVSKLPFYRSEAAWWCMWHNMKTGQSVTAFDPEGKEIGYALFNRAYGAGGELKSVVLKQCELSAACVDREAVFRMLLAEAYGPFDPAVTYKTSDLSMSNPEVVRLHEAAGFITNYEQYLMMMK